MAEPVHHASVGRAPPASVSRLFNDSDERLPAATAGRYIPDILAAIDRAQAVLPDQRTPSIESFRSAQGLAQRDAAAPLIGLMTLVAPQNDEVRTRGATGVAAAIPTQPRSARFVPLDTRGAPARTLWAGLGGGSYHQARTIRQQLAESTVIQLELSRAGSASGTSAAQDAAIAKYQAMAKDQVHKREELRRQALADQAQYDAFNFRDDLFDLSDAAVAVAIALLAVTALTQLWPFGWLDLVPTAFGITMGLAGLLGWSLHPDVLVRWLT